MTSQRSKLVYLVSVNQFFAELTNEIDLPFLERTKA
jgi:hypothetical protein